MKTQIKMLFGCCLLMAIAFFTSGCGSAKETENVNPNGIYTLITLDGNTIPATVSEGGHTIQVLSGSFTFDGKGNCISKMTFVPQGGDQQIMEVNATYTMSDSTLTMKWQNAGITTGTINGDIFTMMNEGTKLVFKK
jgi:hypothetical protein